MTPQSRALDTLIRRIRSALGITLYIGALPQNGGISAEIDGGSDSRYLNNEHGKKTLTVLFLCKDTSSANAYETVTQIGEYIAAMQQADGILGGNIRGDAGLVDKQGDYYIYSIVTEITVKF